MNKIAALTAGSVAGGFARYFLAGWIYRWAGTGFPYGTISVNLAGCLMIGFLAGMAEGKFALSPEARLLLMTGFCGAFTTFSTFILETAELARIGQPAPAIANILVSVLAGYALYRAGFFLAEIF